MAMTSPTRGAIARQDDLQIVELLPLSCWSGWWQLALWDDLVGSKVAAKPGVSVLQPATSPPSSHIFTQMRQAAFIGLS